MCRFPPAALGFLEGASWLPKGSVWRENGGTSTCAAAAPDATRVGGSGAKVTSGAVKLGLPRRGVAEDCDEIEDRPAGASNDRRGEGDGSSALDVPWPAGAVCIFRRTGEDVAGLQGGASSEGFSAKGAVSKAGLVLR